MLRFKINSSVAHSSYDMEFTNFLHYALQIWSPTIVIPNQLNILPGYNNSPKAKYCDSKLLNKRTKLQLSGMLIWSYLFQVYKTPLFLTWKVQDFWSPNYIQWGTIFLLLLLYLLYFTVVSLKSLSFSSYFR